MQLRPEALRFVLAQGLPATIEVAGTSMEPALARGTKVRVVAWLPGSERAGDVVLVATGDADGLLLHRAIHLFSEGGAAFVAHQGDAPGAQLAIVARDAVLGRMVGFAPPDDRAPPTLDRLDAAARARFARRRVACLATVAARRVARVLGVAERPLVRALARRLRALTSRVVG